MLLIRYSNKSVGPNSVLTKMLKFSKNDISNQLSDIFNISFLSGVFPSMIKILKMLSLYMRRILSLISQIIAQSYFCLILKKI